MDVLQFWEPEIDWKEFHQGAISPDVWAKFQELVRLCHAFKYWKDAAREHDRHPSRPDPFYKESAYGRRKRLEEAKFQRDSLKGHMHRAAFLAAGRLWTIIDFVQDRKGTSDWVLSLALVESVGSVVITDTMRGHERAEFDVLAFNKFDASTEIGDDLSEMAARWRSSAR